MSVAVKKTETRPARLFRYHTPKETVLVLRAFRFNIRISIEGWRQIRQRRTVALVIFRALKPVLRGFTSAKLWHREVNRDWLYYETERRVSVRQALSLKDRRARIGFMIRMRRQKFRLTQEDLGKGVGMHRVHISRIEHGKHELHSQAKRQLEKVLGLDLSEDNVHSQ